MKKNKDSFWLREYTDPLLQLSAIALVVVFGGAMSYFTYLADQRMKNEHAAVMQWRSKADTIFVQQPTVQIPGVENPVKKPTKKMLRNPDGILVLVNKEISLPKDYVPKGLVLPTVPYRKDKSTEESSVRPELVEPLKEMFAVAKADGHDLMIASAYRSPSLQQMYFDNYVASSGRAMAEQYSAHPGHSEHQTGLAVDISTEDRRCYLDECFIGMEEGQWLATNAHKFGFMLRYEKGKEAITGYMYEPWHYRYVGEDIATAVYQSRLAYEEFYPYIDQTKN